MERLGTASRYVIAAIVLIFLAPSTVVLVSTTAHLATWSSMQGLAATSCRVWHSWTHQHVHCNTPTTTTLLFNHRKFLAGPL